MAIQDPSGIGALYKHFFDRLIDDLRDRYEFTNAKGGAPKNWHTFGSGTSGFTYATVFASGGRIRVELYIDMGKRALNVAALEVLQAQDRALSKRFGEPLKWELLNGRQVVASQCIEAERSTTRQNVSRSTTIGLPNDYCCSKRNLAAN